MTAKYLLTADGRKASLLAGGNGQRVQHVKITVPANRLHLVRVDRKGRARLKLRPRYEVSDERLVCIDAWPEYDTPQNPDDLLRTAARNHQLERAFFAERSAGQTKRSEAERARRAEIAVAFLKDETQRALTHPAPNTKRCYLVTRHGHMEFHVDRDDGPAAKVPQEALRRFRADVEATAKRRAQARAEQLALHEARKQAAAEWVARYGTDDQRARQAAGVLPIYEVVEAMADQAFQALGHRTRYPRDAAVMQAHVERWTGRPCPLIRPQDFSVVGQPVRSLTSQQWTLLQEAHAAIPDAEVNLHLREFIWRRDRRVPHLTTLSLVVVKKVGAITLRREYLLADEGARAASRTAIPKGALVTEV